MALLLRRLLRFPSTIQSRGFCCAPVSRLSDDDVKVIFEAWADKHGKVYETVKEKESGFQSFKDMLSSLDKENSTCDSSVKLGPTEPSDWTGVEFRSSWSQEPPKN
ncbi:putative actinidain [Helianthus annuus]|nr:putative actinidain [Helianthus annuus]